MMTIQELLQGENPTTWVFTGEALGNQGGSLTVLMPGFDQVQ